MSQSDCLGRQAANGDRRVSCVLLYLAPAPPHPAGGGGALRMAQMLRFLGERYRVEVIAPRLAGSDEARDWLGACGVELTLVDMSPSVLRRWLRLGPYEVDPGLAKAVRARLEEDGVGAVIVEKPAMLPYLPGGRLPPVILDLWAYGGVGVRRALFQGHGIFCRLLTLIRLGRAVFFDVRWPETLAVLLVSHIDEVRCRNQRPERRTVVVPNGVDCAAIAPAAATSRPVSAGPVLLFTGDMGFDPNVEAAERLARNIFPAIRSEYPQAVLRLVGRNPAARVSALEGNGVEVTGAVPDMLPYLQQADLYLAPLHTGAGTRTKLLEAFAAGLSVITTTTGLEGIEAEPGREVLLADDDGSMARQAMELLGDDERRCRIGAASRKMVERRYDWSNCFRPLEALLDSLVDRSEASHG
jgi:glycosyltransferase involved in cell wall biosynthesis